MVNNILEISDESLNVLVELALDYYYEDHVGEMIVKNQNTPAKNTKELTKKEEELYLMGFIDGIVAIRELDLFDCEKAMANSIADEMDEGVPEKIRQVISHTPDYTQAVCELLYKYENYMESDMMVD